MIARHDDLWLVSSGPALVLLVDAGSDRAGARRRAAQAADTLRRDLFEHLTVAPFVDAIVLVSDGQDTGPGELHHRGLRHLDLPGPIPPVVSRIGQLIDDGALSLPWDRHDGWPVAG